jgi:pimeloyl-ACP methyl ester carboxylesterase
VSEETCAVGDVELCFERFGDPSDPAMLLVMGLGTQMLGWHEDFCGTLAARGFHVIRFDNRDIGGSSRLSHLPAPTLKQIALRDRKAAAYSLDDMADDAIGLLDHLGIERAHVVGASMGGMIAQTIAIRHPDRVLSLVSIMSNTGARLTGQPALGVLPIFLKRAPRTREGYVDHVTALFDAIGSPGFDRDDDEMRELHGRAFDRGIDPAGTARQLAAIMTSGNRAPKLRRVAVPALVIHGKADRLVNPSGARATAKAIPGARLLLIDGMGHDLPRGAWPQIVDAIADNAARAGAPADVTAPR